MSKNTSGDSLGDRMKCYESKLPSRLRNDFYSIVRIDGKAFHSYTKGLAKPFSEPLHDAFMKTIYGLFEEVQGACLIYQQSDEITIVIPPSKEGSHLWFDGKAFKIISNCASITTAYFNQNKVKKELAFFDARVFQVPSRQEAINSVFWRYKDWERNSIASLAQSLFSQKELSGKSRIEQKQMCLSKGVDWNDCLPWQKFGTFYTKELGYSHDFREAVECIPAYSEERNYGLFEIVGSVESNGVDKRVVYSRLSGKEIKYREAFELPSDETTAELEVIFLEAGFHKDKEFSKEAIRLYADEDHSWS